MDGRNSATIRETIVAIATPPGRGGVGVVRLSGAEAERIALELLALKPPLQHGRVRLAAVRDLDSGLGTIDEALVTVFHAPRSYTGETVVEIAAHGAPVVMQALLRGALQRGARLAQPGEFTQRAFLSGRMDLTQAEAVHDLIAARTLEQARVAAQQMGGAMSRRVRPAKELLLHLIALLEAGMDFASGELDDVDVVPPEEIASAIAAVATPLRELAGTFRRGQLLRDGAAIALVGPPNAGKSSLFNRLLERERAIVTPLPGTTRDTLEETLALGGVPVRLIDTAGLRGATPQATAAESLAAPQSTAAKNLSIYIEDTAAIEDTAQQIDIAEQMGMARSREAIADADLVVMVHDASLQPTPQEQELAQSLRDRPAVFVANKIDLARELETPDGVVRTSALTGEGMEALRQAILERIGGRGAAEAGALNNLRQQEAVTAALSALQAAAAANLARLPHEVILMDLHGALQALDSLTGTTTAEDILARIFAAFCIGK